MASANPRNALTVAAVGAESKGEPSRLIRRLRRTRDYLLGTLWFVPSLIVLASVVVAVGMVELSAQVDDDALARWPRVFGASADSSRSLLSGVASGMITVAGLVFSLTMIAVTQASSQYTPRILRTFMGDRPSQVVLGVFVGVFAYCLIVLRTIRTASDDGTRFVPSLAVVLGIALAIGSLGVLILFVHHIATILQASSIVARVSRDTASAIDLLFPERLNEAEDASEGTNRSGHRCEQSWRAVTAASTGYVQSVDQEVLVEVAVRTDRVVRMERSVGDFVAEGRPLASITVEDGESAPSDQKGRVAQAFVLGRYRTIPQDAAFGIRQLVDIALRALSPGINDTTTAVSCIDYLGALLLRLADRRIEAPVRVVDGAVRVLVRGPSFDSLLRLSCDEIRQNAAGNVTVLHRLFDVLGEVASGCISQSRREMIKEQISLIYDVALRTVPARQDRTQLRTARERADHQVRA